MIDSLSNYRILVEPDPGKFVDRSGLFEIIESAYIQLCNSNSWFNAYTDYEYLNVVREHKITISKQLDLEGNKKEFSSIYLFCYRERGEFEIRRVDDEGKTQNLIYEFGTGTFAIIYNYMKDWFDEILINVKIYNKKEHE